MSRDPDDKTHVCERCRADTSLAYVEQHDEYWCADCIEDESTGPNLDRQPVPVEPEKNTSPLRRSTP